MIARSTRPLRAASLFALGLVLVLGGCAGAQSGRYPSLALRDVERISQSDANPTQPPPAAPVPPSAELAGHLAQLRRQAEDAHGNFMAELPRARGLVAAASGAPVASEGWSVGQAALSALGAARNPALTALADLDALYVKSELEVGAVEAIGVQRDTVKALVASEDESLDALARTMPTE